MSVINSDTREAWQSIADMVSRQHPYPGRTATVFRGRKLHGESVTVLRHQLDKYDDAFRYGGEASHHMTEMTGRYGYVCLVRNAAGKSSAGSKPCTWPVTTPMTTGQWRSRMRFPFNAKGNSQCAHPRRSDSWPHFVISRRSSPPTQSPPAAQRQKASNTVPHFLVKFTRIGMEPPSPFGKTKSVVCAESRTAAKAMVPASQAFPITASPTTDSVSWPNRCSCRAAAESK